MAGKRITDANALMTSKVWALLRYSDGSEFCFQTTLSSDILRDLGIVLEEGMLPRIDKKYYWDGRFAYRQFPYQEASISLWDACTYTHAASSKFHEFL